MRVIIKGADFSEVSIGKVTRDLSFRLVSNSTEVTIASAEDEVGYKNYSDGTLERVYVYRIEEEEGRLKVILGNSKSDRLQTYPIEVVPGMSISFVDTGNVSTSSSIIPNLVCLDGDKNLLSDPSTYAAYIPYSQPSVNMPFIVPNGVKYVIIQAVVRPQEEKGIVAGEMP